jgi:sulfur-oxidizing protein SoxZ
MRLTMSNVGDARLRIPDRIAKGDIITVNSIVSHPMDTGFFRTKEGAPIPAYFINDVVVTYGGEQIARFEWTSGISRDPVVSFSLKADREGPLVMTWKDNKGEVYSQTVNIAFAAA